MKIVFTVCSNNYLSQAKVLGDSLLEYNPDYRFFICLCDKKNRQVDYKPYDPFEIVEVEKLMIENFEWMIKQYDVVELNTAVKPFFFQYLIQQYPDVDTVMYFDPDIRIFNSLSPIEKELEHENILLTPHILSPIPVDGKKPQESVFLNYGIYNLGFLAVRPTKESIKMLEWWSAKLAIQCFDKTSEGIFVDQLPMNYVPIFYKGVKVSHNPGFNFAYWNFHERKVSRKDNTYFINEDYPLVFFHFSNFKPQYPINITSKQDRFTLEENTVLYTLFLEYAQMLLKSNYNELIHLPVYYKITKILNKLKAKNIFSRMKKKNRIKLKEYNESISHYY